MTETLNPAGIPAPPINMESKAYWDAANEGRLSAGYCGSCNQWHFYPRSICPLCHSSGAELRICCGKGTIYSFSTTMRGAPEPYVIAYVELDEGPRMLTNIVDCPPVDVNIGQRVEVIFITSANGQAVPLFRPCGQS